MSQFAWESEGDGPVETKPVPEKKMVTEIKVELETEMDSEPQSGAERRTMAFSVDEFAAFEERVVRAIKLVQSERKARIAAEARCAELEGQQGQLAPQVELLTDEVKLLRGERDEVRQRIEYLLTQLDALEL